MASTMSSTAMRDAHLSYLAKKYAAVPVGPVLPTGHTVFGLPATVLAKKCRETQATVATTQITKFLARVARSREVQMARGLA